MTVRKSIPKVADTVLVDGHYIVEQRSYVERRKNKSAIVRYDRRKQRDPRLPQFKSIDEVV
ncbi:MULTISPECIES: hypothetical protein [unclassified Shewanella]|uniref:hypothetical protein n=1 Tax=unclassified Shewanella TaxID=196818 RepID=UPI000C82162D|nr:MULTISPECIES: hypothetical protein [unclassified Shewanella]MDO6620692.1 hypothetical protein [Shewanella sp. 6_MG-2023]MDO6640494.1 hypothetical protein [Shewanella sp. 5_MG-2023]MDO6678854.1 hypothetical protein [Shewanella sp. 4_MG-2023]MDO6776175.1 hypothetical protein [Shewanella sp. 3_MG-2023]PMG28534.1 hypothetical protein BCU94_17790 [Shewanella sp. 10N.286.52.C2]